MNVKKRSPTKINLESSVRSLLQLVLKSTDQGTETVLTMKGGEPGAQSTVKLRISVEEITFVRDLKGAVATEVVRFGS